MVPVSQFVFAQDFPATHNRDLTENLLIQSANSKHDSYNALN